jgi:hypothetical protein
MAKVQKNDAEDSNEVERIYRRNALFSSCIIIIYSVAGGHISDEVSLGVAKIKFNNPGYLEFSILIVSLYFCWRHWLVSKELRMRLITGAMDGVELSAFGAKMVKERMHDKRHSLMYMKGDDAVVPEFKKVDLCDVGFMSLKVTYPVITVGRKVTSEVEEFNVLRDPMFFLSLSYKYRLAWFKRVFMETHFGDGILPMALTASAMTLYFWHYFFR